LIVFVALFGCESSEEACERAWDEIDDCMEFHDVPNYTRLSCWGTPKSYGRRYSCVAELYSSEECYTDDGLPTVEDWEECGFPEVEVPCCMFDESPESN